MNGFFKILLVSLVVAGFSSCSNNASIQESKAATNDDAVVEKTADNNEPVVLQADEQEVQESEATDAEGKVQKINTKQFIDKIFDYKANPNKWVYKGDKPAIIDFYADWCGPCKRVAPIMEELAKEYKGKVNFYKINTDEERELSGGVFGIRSIPSILYIPVNGQPMMDMGAKPKSAYVQVIKEKLLK